jgi:ketosteroid isomerase-like protein
MNIFKLKNTYLVLLVLFCGNCAIKAQTQIKPGIRGIIKNLTASPYGTGSDKLFGTLLVESDTSSPAEPDKAVIIITDKTRIYALNDKANRTLLAFEALKLNQKVEVTFSAEPALLTYPMQVGAAEIVILPDSYGLPKNSNVLLPEGKDQNSDPQMREVRRAIDAGNAVWIDAWAKGDPSKISGTLTADSRELVAGGKIYKGSEQILAVVRESMRSCGGRAKLSVTTADVWLNGDTAYETGTAVYEFIAGGKPQTIQRQYFTVWKRQSTRAPWKIYSNVGFAKE